MDLIDLARAIALEVHRGQKDKGGNPYVAHLARVADGVHSPDAKAAAWLHDSIEDTPLRDVDLLAMGIPEHVVDAIMLVTHGDGSTYDAYIDKILASGDAIAMAVKFSDLTDNTRPYRSGQVSESLTNRYRLTLAKFYEPKTWAIFSALVRLS